MHKKEINIGGKKFLVIDLMQPLTMDMEVYPGDPKPVRKLFTGYHDSGYKHYIHEIADHHFQPHCDAPNHPNPELKDKGVEVFDFEYRFNKAIMIDLSVKPECIRQQSISYLQTVTLQHIKPYDDLLGKVGAVIVHTGYDKITGNNLPHNPALIPFFTPEAASYIASFENIKVIGTDSITVDPDGSNNVHRIFKHKMIVESLVHLYEIPEDKRNGFDLQTSPVIIKGATGAPVTAYAFIEK